MLEADAATIDDIGHRAQSAMPAPNPEFDQLVHDAYWHYHREYSQYGFGETYIDLALTQQPNDISRHIFALQDFLRRDGEDGKSLDSEEQLAVLRGIHERFGTDRMPLVLLAHQLLSLGRNWDAFDAICEALRFDPHCEVSIIVLLSTLHRLSVSAHWTDFLNRTASPSIQDLEYAPPVTERFDYLLGFSQAILACEAQSVEADREPVRQFYHHWWKVYRHGDSQIGVFRAYGNSDQSRHIAALRHVIDFATHRRLARGGINPDSQMPEWRETCLELTRGLEAALPPELPVFLLAADYLAACDRLSEALERANSARNTNSRCLLTQHVLDCLEHALDRKAQGFPYEVSFLTETPRRYYGKFCNVPFDEAYINPDGDTFLCCSSILPVPVGNIFKEKSWDAVWNSRTAQEIRASILDGTYKYCYKRSCPAILNNTFIKEKTFVTGHEQLRDRWKEIVSNQSTYITDALFADLGYDISCNLSCPQCRLDLIVLNKDGFERLDAVRDSMVDDLLSKLRRVRATSGGEALFSRHFRKVLAHISPQTCPNLTHLELLTNGMLFNERQWNTFSNLHYLKILVLFSVDACSKRTFETIRRNGRWETMVTNLEFASKLRKQHNIRCFGIAYAVQEENFLEMPEMVRMAERLHVDNLSFWKLENVGTYPDSEYRSRNIADPSHPRHQELLEVICDPVFKSPVIARHNLGPLIEAAHGRRPLFDRPIMERDPFWGHLYE